MSWVDVQDAVHAAFVQASGYGKDKVVWSFQDRGEREMPFVRIHLGGEQGIGQDWLTSDTDLTRPRGMEIRQAVQGVRELPLSFEVFTAEVLGEDAARRRAEKIRTMMRLDSIKDRLSRVGFSIFDPSGTVEYLPTVYGKNFRGRAVCMLRCYLPVMDVEEYVGYIERIRGTIRASDGVTTTVRPFDTAAVESDVVNTYFGLAVPATIDAAFVTALSGTRYTAGFGQNYAYAAGDGTKKAYLAFPIDHGVPSAFRDPNTGFDVPMEVASAGVTVTDAAGDEIVLVVYATVDYPAVAFTLQTVE